WDGLLLTGTQVPHDRLTRRDLVGAEQDGARRTARIGLLQLRLHARLVQRVRDGIAPRTQTRRHLPLERPFILGDRDDVPVDALRVLRQQVPFAQQLREDYIAHAEADGREVRAAER